MKRKKRAPSSDGGKVSKMVRDTVRRVHATLATAYAAKAVERISALTAFASTVELANAINGSNMLNHEVQKHLVIAGAAATGWHFSAPQVKRDV